MARTPGSRNADHGVKREALAKTVFRVLTDTPAARPSLRELASGAGVPVNTLVHYFGDRSSAVAAGFEAITDDGQPHLDRLAALGERSPADGLAAFLSELGAGWAGPLSAAHTAGFAEGFGNPRVGPAYLQGLFEPTLQGLESLLLRWQERGALPPGDVRTAALAFLAPALLVLMHQHDLGGAACRPLDFDAWAAAHLEGWLRGWG